MLNAKTCPKCGGRMAGGFLVTKDSNGWHCATQWVEGEADKSVWTGLKVKDRTVLPLTTYRCGRCALVETYAEPEHKGPQ